MIDPRPGPSRDEKAPRAGPGQCKVCEGPASGFHYSVPACPACKTFFRRVVINQRRYLCIDNDRSTASTWPLGHLRVCKKCRFDRCVDVGMDPIAVLSGSADASTNIVLRDIMKRRQVSLPLGSADKSGSTELRLVVQPRVLELDIQFLIARMLHVEEAHSRIRRSIYQPPINSTFTLEYVMEGPSRFGFQYGEMPGWPAHWEHQQAENRTNVTECLKTAAPFPSNLYQRPSTSKTWHVADPAYAIEFTKTFEFFSKLTHIDNVIICKNIAQIVGHLTQAFYSYERRSHCTEYPDGFKPFGGRIPENSEADKLIYTKAIEILVDLRMDRAEYVLLKAIIICNPAYFGLSSAACTLLSKEREKYAKSLMSYALARRGVKEGPSAYASMMAFAGTLEHICAKIREILHALLALGVFTESRMVPFKLELL